MIWIKEGKIVDIIKNVQPPQKDQKDETLPIYASGEVVDSFLEVNGGFVDQHQIKIGDEVKVIK